MTDDDRDYRLPPGRMVPIEQVKPYPGNPRRIPDAAVDRVRESIETYGYVQPVVVDTAGVIVVGHTRYRALREMGVEQIECLVVDLPEDKAREYRLVDNRTGEMTTWDHAALLLELREFEAPLLQTWFADLADEVAAVGAAVQDVTDADLDRAQRDLAAAEAPGLVLSRVACPACAHVFQVRTDSLQ